MSLQVDRAMPASKDDLRLELVVKQLEEARKEKPGSFDAWQYLRFFPVLITAFESGGKKPSLAKIDTELGKREVLGLAIARATQKPPITVERLQAAIRVESERFLKRPLVDYVIVTPLSIEIHTRRVIRLPSATITLTPSLPRKFEQARRDQEAKTPRGPDSAPARSAWARVRVEARLPREALELAFDQLDLIRGIWIWTLTGGTFRDSHGMPRPLSPVVPGPVHSAHTVSGESVDEGGGWLRTSYLPPSEAYSFGRIDFASVVKAETKIRKLLNRLPDEYASDLRWAIRRYAQALDGTDWESIALKLWSILELLTASSSHTVVVNRAAAVFEDMNLHRTLLHHVRRYRNRVAHEGYERMDSEVIVCETKVAVEALLMFHAFRMGRRFGSRREAAEFLDLSSIDRSTLRRAIRYFGP